MMKPQPEIVGTVTLKASHLFTRYSETASRTDYIRAEPQTVPLKWDGYWLFASFDGVIEQSTFPDAARRVGQPDHGFAQWIHAGFDPSRFDWCDVVVTAGEVYDTGSTYGPGCGMAADRPIRFYRRHAA